MYIYFVSIFVTQKCFSPILDVLQLFINITQNQNIENKFNSNQQRTKSEYMHWKLSAGYMTPIRRPSPLSKHAHLCSTILGKKNEISHL